MTSKIILNADDQIACPHCDSEFPIRDAIAKHLIEQHEGEYQQLLNQELSSIREQASKDAEKSVTKTFKQQLAVLEEQLADSKESADTLQNEFKPKSKRLKNESVKP